MGSIDGTDDDELSFGGEVYLYTSERTHSIGGAAAHASDEDEVSVVGIEVEAVDGRDLWRYWWWL